MDKYYYLMSQLPYLNFGEEPSISERYFLDESAKWMSKKDYACLLQVNIRNYLLKDERSIISDFLRKYIEFEYTLRKELSNWRKSRKEGYEYKSIFFSSDFFKESNPLELEKKLLYLRWKFIEENTIENYYDLDAAIAYYLKLQILLRFFSFNKEKGKEKFQKISEVSFDKNSDLI